jgi:azurin
MFRYVATTAAALFLAAPAFAADCSAQIEGNDQMKYNIANIDVPKSCKEFTVTLKHVGKQPKTVMGHNWVLAKTSDEAAVAKDGMTAAQNNYIKPGDERVIAHTKVVGGGESDSVTFPVSKLNPGEAYSFFCTFPGHVALMKGTVKLQ